MTGSYEPHTPREITHARVGNLAYDLRETIADLSKLRLDPVGAPFVAMELATIMECKTALDVLASNLVEVSDRKLRVVS